MTERADATGSSLPLAIGVVNTAVSVIAISHMSRWLSRDLLTKPLGAIEAEIEALSKMDPSRRSVADVERLADLQDARRRILGEARRPRGFSLQW